MANAQRCRADNHKYELTSAIGAGLQRQKCVNCGSVMIDLTDDETLDIAAAGLFAPRRPTLFSVPTTTETSDESFGRPRSRR